MRKSQLFANSGASAGLSSSVSSGKLVGGHWLLTFPGYTLITDLQAPRVPRRSGSGENRMKNW